MLSTVRFKTELGTSNSSAVITAGTLPKVGLVELFSFTHVETSEAEQF
jgi:hypothetical protein